jgi:cytochrome c553
MKSRKRAVRTQKNTPKKRGPAPTGVGEPIQVRLQPPAMAALKAWIAEQPPPPPSRPEAIRRLIERGMAKCHCPPTPTAEGA